MKDYLATLVHSALTPNHGRNIAREYLQSRILAVLQHGGAMIPLAFHGGTALRFLYATPRYSEDLDFALERAREQYDLRAWLRGVRSELAAEGYVLEVALNESRAVHSAWVRFRGLYYELGLSSERDEVLAIKLEVDTQPPAGAHLATTVVRRHVLLHLQHHNRASLLAGKLHAVLQRPNIKGRDLYDLMWYLSDPNWPAPNLVMLNHALARIGWSNDPLTPDTWSVAVRTCLLDVNWARVQADVSSFLEGAVEAALLTQENLDRLLLRGLERG